MLLSFLEEINLKERVMIELSSANNSEIFIKNTEFLRNFINENESIIENKQDDSELTDLIKKDYRIKSEELDVILSMLASRKKKEAVSKRFRDSVIKNLESYCIVVGIKLYDKVDDNEKVIDLEKLRKRLSVKKHQVKKG